MIASANHLRIRQSLFIKTVSRGSLSGLVGLASMNAREFRTVLRASINTAAIIVIFARELTVILAVIAPNVVLEVQVRPKFMNVAVRRKKGIANVKKNEKYCQ